MTEHQILLFALYTALLFQGIMLMIAGIVYSQRILAIQALADKIKPGTDKFTLKGINFQITNLNDTRMMAAAVIFQSAITAGALAIAIAISNQTI